MTPLILIRHGPTEWNAAGRIQGRTDVPLSAAGEQVVRRWSLPADLGTPPGDWDWLTSPLARTRRTAELLLPIAPHTQWRHEPALMEMSWGAWEGRHLAEIRDSGGAEVAISESRGLDFRPPGGESPRDVQARVAPFLAAVAAAGRPTIAVTHKGVIRAIFAAATAWDMRGPPPVKLQDACAHRFVLAADGAPAVDRLNVPLCEADAAP